VETFLLLLPPSILARLHHRSRQTPMPTGGFSGFGPLRPLPVHKNAAHCRRSFPCSSLGKNTRTSPANVPSVIQRLLSTKNLEQDRRARADLFFPILHQRVRLPVLKKKKEKEKRRDSHPRSAAFPLGTPRSPALANAYSRSPSHHQLDRIPIPRALRCIICPTISCLANKKREAVVRSPSRGFEGNGSRRAFYQAKPPQEARVLLYARQSSPRKSRQHAQGLHRPPPLPPPSPFTFCAGGKIRLSPHKCRKSANIFATPSAARSAKCRPPPRFSATRGGGVRQVRRPANVLRPGRALQDRGVSTTSLIIDYYLQKHVVTNEVSCAWDGTVGSPREVLFIVSQGGTQKGLLPI